MKIVKMGIVCLAAIAVMGNAAYAKHKNHHRIGIKECHTLAESADQSITLRSARFDGLFMFNRLTCNPVSFKIKHHYFGLYNRAIIATRKLTSDRYKAYVVVPNKHPKWKF